MATMRRPRTTPLTIVLILAGAFLAGAGVSLADGPLGLSGLLGSGSHPGAAMEPSRPIQIVIPTLDIRAPIRPVGLAADGAIAAPPLDQAHQAGWYERGPTPGQYGPAVIVGHVDDRTGPAVFHNLADISAGDRIEVTRRDGRTAVFEATGVRTYHKTGLPVDEVYGDYSTPGLRLITCGGRWLGGGVGYADNVVVYATLINPD